MLAQPAPSDPAPGPPAPCLPLAFRLGAAFGLLVLQLALPTDLPGPLPGETCYLACLGLVFLEATWEVHRNIARGRTPFANPSPNGIRVNLLLDVLLITLLIAYQGVDRAQLASFYVFPVLASAFYLDSLEIIGVAVIASGCHIIAVLLLVKGLLPPFGRSGPALDLDPGQLAFVLGIASLLVFSAALVVVLIRQHMVNLRTDLNKSETVVGELSSLYQRVFESMFSGIITTDLEGRITSANPAAQTILRRPLGPGSPIDVQGFGPLADLGNRLEEGRFELEITTPEGEPRVVGGNLVALRGPAGQDSGHLLVFQDLTQLKALQERNRLNERLATVGGLSSAMAHELRNPMASILGCVHILREGGQPPAMLERVLTILDRESQRVSELVNEFLDFARPRPARLETLRLPAIIEEVRSSWETDPRGIGLALAAGDPPDLPVRGDPAWVHQVFTNLLSNARKALRATPAPELRIDYRRQGGAVRVRVRDNGCGMTEERRRLLFIPFSSGFEEGTGLGMCLVLQFVQRMGWDIQVDSAPGRGTSVSLIIPVAAEPDSIPNQPGLPAAAS